MLKEVKRHLRTMALVIGFGGAAVVFLAAGAMDRLGGRDVLMVSPYDAATIELNRVLHAEGDPVAEIYGNPLSRTVRVLFVAEDRIVHPQEDPRLTLLPVDKIAGDNPLQAQTLWFFARFMIVGLVVLGAGGLILPRRWRRESLEARGTAG